AERRLSCQAAMFSLVGAASAWQKVVQKIQDQSGEGGRVLNGPKVPSVRDFNQPRTSYALARCSGNYSIKRAAVSSCGYADRNIELPQILTGSGRWWRRSKQ